MRLITRMAASALVLATILAGVGAPQPASAISGSEFDAGYIISDAAFFDAASMNEQQIQEFLQRMVPNCAGGAGQACLKDYVEATINRAPVATNHCGPYAGSPGERASTIIFKVAQACNISPKVLLATLQKERGLVTKTSPTASDYRVAMGYGCPDTAPCATEYYGFANQMYLAARQFRQYTYRPASFRYRVGVNSVQFHPNAACGSTSVDIRNQATANLYNYTPYQPNAASLTNLNGSGDACSSYGNRNFWNYYFSWFGNPAFSVNPYASLDVSTVATTPSSATIRLAGWAIDPAAVATSVAVHVYITDPNGATTGYAIPANQPRADVAAAYPGAGSAHGFSLDVQPQQTGSYRSCIYVIRSAGPFTYGCQFFLVTQDSPSGSLDSASANLDRSPGTLDVSGWAVDDINPTRSTDVHVYVRAPDGTRPGYVVRADGDRPDVGRVLPNAGSRHGFALSIPLTQQGAYEVCAFAIGTPLVGSNNANIGCRTVAFGPSSPTGSVDSVVASAADAITVTGWAFDDGQRARSTQVHVYVTAPGGGMTGTAVTADRPRPDVGRAFPEAGSAHGFSFTQRVSSPGVYRACTYAIGSPAFGNTNRLLSCVDVRVGLGEPRGSLDGAAVSNGQLVATGWGLDATGPSTSTAVHVYVTSPSGRTAATAVPADDPRPDVAAAFPGAGALHGFSFTTAATEAGSYRVCAYAIASSGAGAGSSLIGCRST